MPQPRFIGLLRPKAERSARWAVLLLGLYLAATVLLPGLHAATHQRAHDHHAGGLHYHTATDAAPHDHTDSEDSDHAHPHAHTADVPHHTHADHDTEEAGDVRTASTRALIAADSAVAHHSPLSDHAAGSPSHAAQSHLGTPVSVTLPVAALAAMPSECRAVQDAHRVCQVSGSLGARAPPLTLAT